MGNWNFYQANINGKLASIYLDLEAFDEEISVRLPKVAWYWIKMENPRNDGLSSEEDFQSLADYEDEMLAFLSNTPIKLVGRITTQGRREFYFYLPSETNFNGTLSQFIGQEPNYLFQIGEQPDPEWVHYKNVLYPGPKGLQQIKGRKN